MTLPHDIIERLDALGESHEYYDRMMRSEGEGFVRHYLNRVEERASLYREWSPVLREFAADCRRDHSCPHENMLPPRDQSKAPIYETMIKDAERPPLADKEVAVFYCLPLIAIPIARRLWPGADDRGVFLTREEIEEWQRIYSHPEDAFWWFVHMWWRVEDPPDKRTYEPAIEPSVPNGEPWLAVSGMSWGGLAGGEDADLWSWDGEKAEFVSNFYVSTF
jgi:hypothetical protein